MPELPEVETTRAGIEPKVAGRPILDVIVRDARLRWPVPTARLRSALIGSHFERVDRRAKYLLFRTGGSSSGTMLVHLGMSGSLRIVPSNTPLASHDHIDIVLDGGCVLRYRDPRRFGCFLWTRQPDRHRLLAKLGPEPLTDDFNGDDLYRRSRSRKTPLRNFLLDSGVVVGIGNIYASEAAHVAGILPQRQVGRISRERYERLVDGVRSVLEAAIAAGGTTLRDFRNADGLPGYFQRELQVYDRGGEACRRCGGTIRRGVLSQRSYYYCPRCQR